MENWNMKEEGPACQNKRVLLSEYIENTLSARDTWDLEKHLAECGGCADYLQQMQTTVQLLHIAPRLDTSDDFMARLHGRLDGLEPEAMHPLSRFAGFREWLAGFGEKARSPRLPALGLGLSLLVLVAVMAKQQIAPQSAPTAPPVGKVAASLVPVVPAAIVPPTPVPTQQLQHNVAPSASNPFDDPAATNLEAHSADEDNDDNDTSGS